MNNVSDILKQLDTLNEVTCTVVFVPSLKKNIRFKNLNLKQQKELLKSSIDDTITKLSFTTKFYDIIKENAIDQLDVNSLFVFDRIAIALALRVSGLDSSYTADNKTIDLSKLITQNTTIDIDPFIKNTTLELENLHVQLEVPKLFVDRVINSATITKLKTSTDKDVKTLIGELFVYEIIKFIRSISFKKDDGTVIETILSDLSIEERVSIVEKLPSTVTGKILTYIREYRVLESKLTTIEDISIDIDSNFFSI